MTAVHVQPWPGEGLVARLGANVLVVAEPAAPSAVELLLSRCASAGGRALVEELATLATASAQGSGGGFGVLTPVPGGVAVFLAGSLRLHGTAGGAEHDLDATGVVSWIEQTLPGPVEALALGPAGVEPPGPSPWLGLSEGVVRGAGALVLAEVPAHGPAPAERPDGDPSPAGPAERSFTSIPLGPDPGLLADREPLPAGATGGDEPAGGAGEVLVKGFRCPRDHHNRPDASYCCICGIKMGTNRTLVLVDGPRPPLGVLVFDDGSSVPVRNDLLIGREPGGDPLVTDDAATPVRIEDDTQSVSRAHLHVVLRDWDVLVADRGSSNGTLIQPAAGAPWERLPPREPRLVLTGARLRLGERELVFDQLGVR